MTSFYTSTSFFKYFCHQFPITFVASLHRLLHRPLTKFLMALVYQFQVESVSSPHRLHSCSLPSQRQLALSHSLAHPLAQAVRPSHPRTISHSPPQFLPVVHRFPHDHATPFSTSLRCSFHHSFNRKSPFPKREWTLCVFSNL